MAGIQDLGNGRGYIYMTNLSNVILKTVRNTNVGARDLRAEGLVVAPMAAKRSAYGQLNILTAAGSGTITAINVNGVNQIPSPITVASTDPAVVAAQVATAINGFTPASIDCTASALAGLVLIFAPEQLGETANGYAITVSVTGGAITSSTVAMANGSSDDGIVDTNLGRNFYLNADYDAAGISGGDPADPQSLTNAVDITSLMVTRGMQVGFPLSSIEISGDLVTGIDRASAITVLEVDTQGLASTDKLDQIQTADFVVGDILLIRGTSPARNITIESLNAASGIAPTPNILLNNDQQFVTNGSNTLMVQLRQVPTVGTCWVELNRSTSTAGAGVIVLQLAEAQSLISSGNVIRGQQYLISDYSGTDLGYMVRGASSSAFEASGAGGFYVPAYDGAGNFSNVTGFNAYLGTWYDGASPSIGDVVTYAGYNFKNTTGTNNYSPLINTDNEWELLPRSVTTGFYVEWHFLVCDLGAISSGIIVRADGRGNKFNDNNTGNHLNFKWGCTGVLNNVIEQGAIFYNVNAHNGTGGIPNHLANTIITGSSITDCDNAVSIQSNYLKGSAFYENGNCQLWGNNLFDTTVFRVLNGATVQANTLTRCNVNNIINILFWANTATGTTIINLNATGLGGTNLYRRVTNFILNYSYIGFWTWTQDRVISAQQFNNSTLINLTFRAATDATGTIPVTTTDVGYGLSTYDNVYLDFQNNWDPAPIVNYLSSWGFGIENLYANAFESNMYGWLDISAASVYNASTKTLTLPAGYESLGEIFLKNTSGQDIRIINDIQNYRPNNARQFRMFGKKFRIYDGTGVTFTPIAKASYNTAAAATGVTNGFMGTTPVTLTRTSEYVWMKRVVNDIYIDKSVQLT